MPKPVAGSVLMLSFLCACACAHAQWSSRSEAGFVAARGNTTTETANAKLEIVRELERWKHTFAAGGLYGKTSRIASAQRWDARFQTQRSIGEHAFWFGALRWEDDRYSGFDYQGNVSSGFGRKWLDTDATKLSTQIGAGYRALRHEELIRDDTNAVIQRIPGERDSDIVANGALTLEHAFNDSTKLLDSLLIESGRANTLTRNELSLQVKMNAALALSLGYSVRNNSNPQSGLERTDTLITVNLVYARPGL